MNLMHPHHSLLRQESAVGSPWQPCAVSEHEQEHWPFGSLLFANRFVVLQFVTQLNVLIHHIGAQ